MKRLFLYAPFVLAACGSQPAVKAENASVAEVAAKAQTALRLSPGEWKGTTEIVTMEMPGMPAGALNQAKTKTDYTSCLTQAQIEKPPAEMFGGKANGECRYEHFTMAGGKIDALMICTPKGSGEMRMTMTGDYDSEKYNVTNDMVMKMPSNAGGHTMTIKARTSGARVGACKA
jgi:hypothetical protein